MYVSNKTLERHQGGLHTPSGRHASVDAPNPEGFAIADLADIYGVPRTTNDSGPALPSIMDWYVDYLEPLKEPFPQSFVREVLSARVVNKLGQPLGGFDRGPIDLTLENSSRIGSIAADFSRTGALPGRIGD